MPLIPFTPDQLLDGDRSPEPVAVKGQVPRLVYPFTLKDLYPTVPALDAHAAYRHIAEAFGRADHILHERARLRGRVILPPVENSGEALAVLRLLFDPTSYTTDGIWVQLAIPEVKPTQLFELDDPHPFPLRLASDHKLLHTLAWIDTNVKLGVERQAKQTHLDDASTIAIAEAALTIYCLLVKQQDYRLARGMNFNHSMFLQDRILNLLFGDELYLGDPAGRRQGMLSNRIAFDLLKGISPLSLHKLCLASVFLGVIWTGDPDLQERYQANPGTVLGDIETQLVSDTHPMGVDHIERFLREAGRPGARIAVVLDDNGESVFDLALFQQLLREAGELQVSFVVNRYPISNNISEEAVELLLRDPFFADLARFIQTGRAELLREEQVFRSFETGYLKPATRRRIEAASMVYVKGANFFETFQLPRTNSYHAFTVHGEMSETLTGCPDGTGIWANLPPGRRGYIYHGPADIETLIALVEKQDRSEF